MTRHAGTSDGREHKVVVTQEGLAIVHALETTREKLVQPILAQWDEQDSALDQTLAGHPVFPAFA